MTDAQLRSYIASNFINNSQGTITGAKMGMVLNELLNQITARKATYFTDFDIMDDSEVVCLFNFDWASVGDGSHGVSTRASKLTLTTGASSGNSEGIMSMMAGFNAKRTPNAVTKFQIIEERSDQSVYFGFCNQARTEYAFITVGVDKTSFYTLAVKEGGVEQTYTSQISIHHLTDDQLSIWLDDDGTVHWAINDVEQATTGITKKCTGDKYLALYIKTGGSVAFTMDVDWLFTEKIL